MYVSTTVSCSQTDEAISMGGEVACATHLKINFHTQQINLLYSHLPINTNTKTKLKVEKHMNFLV